jgi:hypothetical protein
VVISFREREKSRLSSVACLRQRMPPSHSRNSPKADDRPTTRCATAHKLTHAVQQILWTDGPGTLLDHLFSAPEALGRHFEPKRFGGPRLITNSNSKRVSESPGGNIHLAGGRVERLFRRDVEALLCRTCAVISEMRLSATRALMPTGPMFSGLLAGMQPACS